MNGKFSKLKDIHSRFTWLELLLLTGWIFLMCIYISPGSFRHTVGFMLRNPLLTLLNVLPIAVLLLVIYFACMNSFAAGAAANLVFGLLSYANLLKIEDATIRLYRRIYSCCVRRFRPPAITGLIFTRRS